MGTIAEKIQYLDQTRELLKDNINKINNVLTDESTFRSYPEELFNGYLDILNNGTDTLWENLEKVSQEDVEETELSNVVTAPMKITLKGNTTQETTTGKNLFKIRKASITAKGITYTPNDDGTFNLSGTATGVVEFYTISTISNSNLEVGKQYNLNSNIICNNDTFCIYLHNSNDAIWVKTQMSLINNMYSKTATLTESSGSDYKYVIRVESGKTLDLKNIKIQLELGPIATDWEKFTGGQPSPNPDYPQEVQVVTGENVVSVQGKNLFDLNKHTNTLDVNTTIINSNEYTCNIATTWRGRVIVPITSFKKNTDYTFSYTSNNQRSIISRISGVKDGVSRNLVQNYYYNYTNKATINTDNYDEIIVDLYATGNGNTLESTTISNIQFEEGTTATDYEPYLKTDYPISLGTTELCKIRDYQDYLYKNNDKWYLHKEIDKMLLDEDSALYGFSNHNGTTYITANFNDSKIKRLQYSNIVTNFSDKLIGATGAQTWGGTKLYSVSQQSDGNYIQICLPYSIATTLTELLTWLALNNILIYYVLETPTDTEITNTTLIEQLNAIAKAKSVEDKTYITQENDNLPFILDVKAIKEYNIE